MVQSHDSPKVHIVRVIKRAPTMHVLVYLAEGECPRPRRLWADILVSEHSLEYSSRPTRVLLLKKRARSRINAAVSPRPNHLGRYDNQRTVFAVHVIHDCPNMENVGECSRHNERLPIKSRKKTEEMREKTKKKGRLCHFEFRTHFLQKKPLQVFLPLNNN